MISPVAYYQGYLLSCERVCNVHSNHLMCFVSIVCVGVIFCNIHATPQFVKLYASTFSFACEYILIAVARLESTFFKPSFAKIAVAAANTADSTA